MSKKTVRSQATKTARAVKRGDVVKVGRQEEVVRSVSVVLHLANGVDHPIDADSEMTLVLDPDPEVE